ncbi:MAG: ATP-binding cassette domain-containing protein [Fimbriimonadaceae bacterium]
MIVSAHRLGKRFGDRWLFRNLAFELNRGDSMAVTGSNGRGKTSLLRIVAGLLRQTEGFIEPPKRIGIAGINTALYAELTPPEHLVFFQKLLDVRRADPARILDEVGLSGVRCQSRQMSTGMQMRLRLAIATVGEPDLLILDEPTSGLDREGRALVGRICEAQKERGALILATNDREDLNYVEQELDLDAAVASAVK